MRICSAGDVALRLQHKPEAEVLTRRTRSPAFLNVSRASAAAVRPVGQRERAAHRQRKLPRDREAERAARLAVARRLHAPERLEHRVELIVRNAGPRSSTAITAPPSGAACTSISAAPANFSALSTRLPTMRRSAFGRVTSASGARLCSATSCPHPCSRTRCCRAAHRDRSGARLPRCRAASAHTRRPPSPDAPSRAGPRSFAPCASSSIMSARRRIRVIGVCRSCEIDARICMRSAMYCAMRSCIALNARARATSDGPPSFSRSPFRSGPSASAACAS